MRDVSVSFVSQSLFTSRPAKNIKFEKSVTRGLRSSYPDSDLLCGETGLITVSNRDRELAG